MNVCAAHAQPRCGCVSEIVKAKIDDAEGATLFFFGTDCAFAEVARSMVMTSAAKSASQYGPEILLSRVLGETGHRSGVDVCGMHTSPFDRVRRSKLADVGREG